MHRIPICAILSLGALTLNAQTGFDVKSIDSKADPCTDFYQYACGTWLANNPVPSDQSTWGRFSELLQRNQNVLRDILETSSAKKGRSAVEQKIGDYFAACVDEKTIESKGIEP